MRWVMRCDAVARISKFFLLGKNHFVYIYFYIYISILQLYMYCVRSCNDLRFFFRRQRCLDFRIISIVEKRKENTWARKLEYLLYESTDPEPLNGAEFLKLKKILKTTALRLPRITFNLTFKQHVHTLERIHNHEAGL